MNIDQFANQLRTAVSEAQIRTALREYLGSFGIRSFAFTYYAGHTKSGRQLHYHCVSAPLRAWHEYYLEQAYADVDRTLEDSHLSTLPVFWDVQEQLTSAKNIREQRIRQESIEFGIDKGLSVPVHGPNHDFATLTLHQRRNETCLADYQSRQYEWISAAQIYYHYIRKMIGIKNAAVTLVRLTTREEQCLTLTAKSWRVEKIAKELGISARTVNFHLQNANKKLGTNNKYQACNKFF